MDDALPSPWHVLKNLFAWTDPQEESDQRTTRIWKRRNASQLKQARSLRQFRIEMANGVEDVEEWEELVMAVKKGASASVIRERIVKYVTAKNLRPDIKNDVAENGRTSIRGLH